MSKERAKLNSLLEKTIDAEVNQRVASIKAENEDLNARVQRLQGRISELTLELDNVKHDNSQASVMYNMINAFKDKFYSIEQKPEREELVYKMLECFFDKDFEENTYECPIWLGACTQFYSHKKDVVNILKALEIYVPDDVDNFRLPHEWTTDELDIFFDTMRKHIVCNSCTYADNLRFWQPHALDDVYNVCYNCLTYTEIPWQFLLRNPNLLNKKYLKKIGKMAYEEPYVSGWRYLFAIDKYQELTDEQLKTIIKEIDGPSANISKENSVSEFLLRHLDLIEDDILIDKIYKKWWDSYSFRYENRILKMPVEYLELWVKEKTHGNPSEALEWIIRNKNNFSEEQKNNLLKLVMSEVLK